VNAAGQGGKRKTALQLTANISLLMHYTYDLNFLAFRLQVNFNKIGPGSCGSPSSPACSPRQSTCAPSSRALHKAKKPSPASAAAAALRAAAPASGAERGPGPGWEWEEIKRSGPGKHAPCTRGACAGRGRATHAPRAPRETAAGRLSCCRTPSSPRPRALGGGERGRRPQALRAAGGRGERRGRRTGTSARSSGAGPAASGDWPWSEKSYFEPAQAELDPAAHRHLRRGPGLLPRPARGETVENLPRARPRRLPPRGGAPRVARVAIAGLQASRAGPRPRDSRLPLE
jgi:hypothetical protein